MIHQPDMTYAQEIFANPFDLEIMIYEEEAWKHTIIFRRGPGGNYKNLFKVVTPSRTFDDSVVAVQEILEAVEYHFTKGSSGQRLVSPWQGLIRWITLALQQDQEAKTYLLPGVN